MSGSSIAIRRPPLVPALISLLPTAAFLAFDAWLGLVPAMIAASVLTVVLIVVRRMAGRRTGILLPLGLTYVVLKAVAGILTQSHVVYFGAGVALSALIAVAVGATAFTRRPVASFLIPLVTPYRRLTPDHPVYRRVAAHVTAVWAVVELGIAGWEGWHLTVASVSEFVIMRTVGPWMAMGVLIFFLIFYVRFRLDRYEWALTREERG
ncbi:hypothetical protein [Microbacterium immunditiarum]|uniref:DUF3159 domain-containing protein n=1 Tax=Microbacterium immunditiarum TaxID=337480 RepID=A0A7Y9KGZ8_9MICO|nr:hypothetical protein [Microbacterium immunditiarum]NYE18982.1 hypothetical protein [Microbacterium immunditiarum]